MNTKLRILLVHNFYKNRGGEYTVFQSEKQLLKDRGHVVETFEASNLEIDRLPVWKAASDVIWSFSTYNKLTKRLRQFRPDIVHFHNVFLRISPSAYYACHRLHIPTVQTIHNFRLVCPKGTLLRSDQICRSCVGKKVFWPSVRYSCYRDSRAQSFILAMSLSIHKTFRTWQRLVDGFIFLSNHSKKEFARLGFPKGKLYYKPNGICGQRTKRKPGNYVLFVGRISSEKGIQTLCEAARILQGEIPIHIIGDGPERKYWEEQNIPGISWHGRKTRATVFDFLHQAKFLIFPSIWYEICPMTILEAYSCGTPVLASNIGAMVDLVQEGKTGRFFSVGDAQDLADQIRNLWRDHGEIEEMSKKALECFWQNYHQEVNYQNLLKIYQSVHRKKLIATP